ncbi:hypothetical protein ACPZ19_27420 [Amycolatopsis lurida]
MRTAESVRRRSVDRRRTPPLPNPWTPKSFAMSPPVVVPHPPLAWERPDLAVPRRLPAFRSVGKTPGMALTWALLLGPLGLCYLSIMFGLVATMAAVVAIVVGGAVLVAVIWPAAVMLALLAFQRQR